MLVFNLGLFVCLQISGAAAHWPVACWQIYLQWFPFLLSSFSIIQVFFLGLLLLVILPCYLKESVDPM